jgi:pyrimidine operon attenuation protein / uracil phosphoribosyltransferase
MSNADARQIVDAAGVAEAVAKLAGILSAALRNRGSVFLAGVPTRGVTLAARLQKALELAGMQVACGAVDISMHRDDLGLRSGVQPLRGTELPLDLENWSIVIVDDVQQTGRTARAAMEAVLAFGRPKRIFYAVLADRGGRELPVRPDFTALELPVPTQARLRVRLAENDGGEEGIFQS